MPHERRLAKIRPAPSLQHLHLWPAKHRLQKVCIAEDLAIIHACWWRLSGSGRSAQQRHGNRKWTPPDLEAKAQHYKNGVIGLLPLQHKEAKREQNVNHSNGNLSFCSKTKYLWVTLDRSLTYRRHLKPLCKKLTSRIALLRQLAGSGWDVGTTKLQTATPFLALSTAEYWAPVRCCSADTRLIDLSINDALRIVTGYLRPTPADILPILAGTQPAESRR